MIVKICGLTSVTDAIYANMAGPDWAGLVFHEKSRRCVSADDAAAIRDMLGKGIRTVGVTVDRDVGFIRDLVSRGIIDMVQVHANPDESYFRSIADLGVPTIRAYVIGSKGDVEEASSCEADHVMLDAGSGSDQRPGSRQDAPSVRSRCLIGRRDRRGEGSREDDCIRLCRQRGLRTPARASLMTDPGSR